MNLDANALMITQISAVKIDAEFRPMEISPEIINSYLLTIKNIKLQCTCVHQRVRVGK